MRYGVTFGELLEDLKAELAINAAQGASTAQLPRLKRAINSQYRMLYDDFDWPHLRRDFELEVTVAGERYYDPPDGLNVERIEQVNALYNGQLQPMAAGIEPLDYTSFNSIEGERSDPPYKWAIRYPVAPQAATMIELWPIPASNTVKVLFSGIAAAPILVNDDDVCLLDAETVILYAAAAIAPSAETQKAVSRARERLGQMRRRSGVSERTTIGVKSGVSAEVVSGKAVVRVS